ncbi:MAG: hypothetical protein QF492_03460, partial [Candidatus Krumholzibacteria bacterium]|nr:hypothetical protein [Candidatus Krumholzibacteria bacterium]
MKQEGRKQVLVLLRRELRRARWRRIREFLPPMKRVQAGLAILFLLFLRFFPPENPEGGQVFSLLFILALILPVLIVLLRSVRDFPDPRRLLRRYEEEGRSGQMLETARELSLGQMAGKGYSPELLSEVLRRSLEELGAGLPEAKSSSLRRAWLLSLPFILGAIVLILLPTPAGIAPWDFLLHPTQISHYEESAFLLVCPGDQEILAGEALMLEAREEGLPWRFPGRVKLEIDETGDLFRELPLREEDGRWSHELRDLKRSFRYRFRRGRSRSELFSVEVYYPPLLDSLKIRSRPPAYTGLPEEEHDLLLGQLPLPQGSELELRGGASSSLSEAWLHFNEDSLSLDIEDRQLSAKLNLEESLKIHFSLCDLHDCWKRGQRTVEILALEDRDPEVRIMSPASESSLKQNLRVQVEVLAIDDYGLDSLELFSRILGRPDTVSMKIPLEGKPLARRAEVFDWKLEGRNLLPGDILEYWIEARDNRPAPAGRGRSAAHRLRLPSLREVYEGLEERGAERDDFLDDMIEESRELSEDLKRLEEEFRADPELDWEVEEELEKAFEKQKELSEQLGELSRQMQEGLEEFQENQLLSEDMNRKLEQIQELLEELEGSEAGEILKRFQEMLDEMNPGELADELQELRLDEEALLEQLERTREFLEQVMREQKMNELLQRTDELMEEQSALRKETADAEDEKMSGELAGEQEGLAEKTEELMEDVGETASEMSEEFPDASEKMQEDSPSPSEPMRDAAQEMENPGGQPDSSQKEAEKQLLKLYWRIARAQSMIQGKMDAETLEGFEKLTAASLELSLRIENRSQEVQSLLRAGQDQQRESSRQQMNLLRSAERFQEAMQELSRKSLTLAPLANRLGRRLLEGLKESVSGLEAGKAMQALKSTHVSLDAANRISIELLHGMQMEGQGGGSCSSPGSLGQMKSMLQKQEQLNRESGQMKEQMGPGGLSPGERAALQRLKAEQGKIREGMGEMMEGGESSLGRLDRILEDMKQVEKDLAEGRLSDETLRRQEKIFDNMLDAQRSLHRRDFKRERKSRSAEDLRPLWPGDRESDDPMAALRDAIRRGLR